MHAEPRTGAIDRIYLHTNEGPQHLGAAQGLVNYLHTIDAGYHVVVDSQVTVRAANDDQVVWGAGGDNSHSLHVCMIGYASQDWSTPYALAEMDRAAQQVAEWVIDHGVPLVRVTGAPGQAPTARGICEHADNHHPNSQGHTDPGAGFPFTSFLAKVKKLVSDHNALVTFLHLVASFVKPIRKGDKGARVRFVQTLLRRKHLPCPLTGVFDLDMTRYVHQYKATHGWKNPDGSVAGLPLVQHLLK